MTPQYCLAFVVACLVAVPAPTRAQEPKLSPAELRADLEELVDHIGRTHPDLGYVTDIKKLSSEAAKIGKQLEQPMTVREAWMALARLNPFFADAHAGLRHPAAQFEAYQKAGGAVFPVPVFIDRQGALRAAAGVPQGSGLRPFERIAAINGRRSDSIIAALMPRMRGETESLRRLILAFNFPAYLWTLTGDATAYRVDVADLDGRQREVLLPSAPQPPAVPPPSLSFPRPGVALLRVPSFDPSLRDRFGDFMDRSSAEIELKGARTLLIDIRDNPGGAHDVSDQLVAWLTDRPVSPSSALTARITADNRDISPQAAIGTVVTVPFDEPISARGDGRRFGGDVYVLMSQDSYSQAIVFAATIKDHGLGTLVGEQTGGAANQTGQITLHPLTHSRLEALAPLYVIYRPSGDRARAGLLPDVVLAHDPIHPEAMLDRLLARLPNAPHD